MSRLELWRRSGQVLDDVGEYVSNRWAEQGQDGDDTAGRQDTHDQQNHDDDNDGRQFAFGGL